MATNQAIAALSLPSDEAADLLTSLPETQWFERKSGRISPRDLAVPLVAMANADGGTVVVGIHSGKVEPLDEKKQNAIRQAAIDFTSPIVNVRIHDIVVSGGVIMLIEVESGGVLHETVSGDAYLRIGDESRKLTFAQRREMAYDRGTEVFSATVLKDLTAADLNGEEAETYQKAIGASSIDAMLAARDMTDSDGHLRVAAWLMFGKHPSRGFPNAHVRVLHYGSTDRGTGSAFSLISGHDVRYEGTIPQQIDKASTAIDEWIGQRKALDGSGRFTDQQMIPRDVWLEGLVNAVIHRSYSLQGDHIRVEIFPNRMEISSPGRFPNFSDPNTPESVIRYARNPRIARACAELGYAFELGEGIKRMFAAMNSHGLSAPVYSQTSGHVVLTLFGDPRRDSVVLSKGADAVLTALRLANEPVKTGELAELAGMSRPTAIRHLNALKQAGFVRWNGMSSRDPNAVWAIA